MGRSSKWGYDLAREAAELGPHSQGLGNEAPGDVARCGTQILGWKEEKLILDIARDSFPSEGVGPPKYIGRTPKPNIFYISAYFLILPS